MIDADPARLAPSLLNDILDSIEDGFAALDSEFRFIFLNRAGERMLRVFNNASATIMGRRPWEVFPDLVGSAVEAFYRQALVEGRKVEFENFHAPLDTWFHVRVYPAQHGLSIYFQDITEHKRQAQALFTSQERFRIAFSEAPIGMIMANLEGQFVQANHEFCALLGYTPEELSTMTFADISLEEDIGRTQHEKDQLMSGAKESYTLRKRYVRKDGVALWAMATVTLLRDETGAPQQFIGVLEDITERHEFERKLVETSERLQLALDAGALGDWHWEAATDLVTLSPRAAVVFGLPADTPVTWARMRDILHEEDAERARVAVEHALTQRSIYSLEYRVTRPGGEKCWVAANGRGQYGPNGEVLGMTGVVQDITKRKADEGTLLMVIEERKVLLERERAARAETERMSASKDEFLATLSHELRTPLSAILGWVHVLRRDGVSPADLAKGLESIERNARAQTRLIEDLLDMSRITAGTFRIDSQPLVPASFVGTALDTVAPAAQARDITIDKRLDLDAGWVLGDAGRLQQVIWNLLTNAIKFTPRGGRVSVVLERIRDHVEISVTDTGQGIHATFLPRVFDRFSQSDSSPTRSVGGLGLGLAIVKQLVEMHGGWVRAESKGIGHGATFVVSLPLAVGAGAMVERLGAKEEPPCASPYNDDLQGIRVLVVEDDDDARELLQRTLEECGAEVQAAPDAHAGLQLIRATSFDVLVSDIGMPGLDGFALLKQIRQLPDSLGGRIPAVALTAFAREEDKAKALAAGFAVHLTKPVVPAELVRAVAGVVKG